ncbi:MAG: thiol reductase thioredoxin, partial [Cyanobacteria bacterium]|nr:thiol reductase thioredoxin [Cyanobacteriota bacterium]
SDLAPWCGPCRQLTPVLEAIATENQGKVLFVKVNVDESTELATKYSINSLPTVITFKGGAVVEEHYGVISKATLKDSIQKLLK